MEKLKNMKCPQCKKEECYYIEKRKRSEVGNKEPLPRKNSHAKCRKCGWNGVI